MARRKTFRKEGYLEFPNCFNRESEASWRTYLPENKPLILELGCGKADFSYEMATKHPERNFIGVDLKPDRLWYPAKQALDNGVGNIAFLHIHLNELHEKIASGEADELWVTFPDPFPKNRHAKHRTINTSFLKIYEQVLRPGGKVHFKTDNLPLFQFGLEVFVREGNVRFHALSFDLHEDEHIGADAKVLTAYERKFMEMGLKINYVCFSFAAPAGGVTS